MADFDQIYWAHQPPEIQLLRTIPDMNQLQTRAMQLATMGFTIDVPIMIWGWDPLKVMQLRQSFGYTWVPSALMPPVQMAPGLTAPGAIAYDPANPPRGAVNVSTDPADYPTFIPPVPPTPVTEPVVGVAILGMPKMFYALGVATTWADGTVTSDSRGVFRLHRVRGPMADSVWFEQVS
jgi:hypothetical protein